MTGRSRQRVSTPVAAPATSVEARRGVPAKKPAPSESESSTSLSFAFDETWRTGVPTRPRAPSPSQSRARTVKEAIIAWLNEQL